MSHGWKIIRMSGGAFMYTGGRSVKRKARVYSIDVLFTDLRSFELYIVFKMPLINFLFIFRDNFGNARVQLCTQEVLAHPHT